MYDTALICRSHSLQKNIPETVLGLLDPAKKRALVFHTTPAPGKDSFYMLRYFITQTSQVPSVSQPVARAALPGPEKDFPQSVRPGIPMSPKASSVSDEADTLDRSHLHGLKGTWENSFSGPGSAALATGWETLGTCEV